MNRLAVSGSSAVLNPRTATPWSRAAQVLSRHAGEDTGRRINIDRGQLDASGGVHPEIVRDQGPQNHAIPDDLRRRRRVVFPGGRIGRIRAIGHIGSIERLQKAELLQPEQHAADQSVMLWHHPKALGQRCQIDAVADRHWPA